MQAMQVRLHRHHVLLRLPHDPPVTPSNKQIPTTYAVANIMEVTQIQLFADAIFFSSCRL